jgi:hypothetical protein
MSESPRVGSIDIHNVTRDNVECRVHDHDNFSTIQIHLGVTSVTLYVDTADVAAIRRILGGWQ